MPIRAVIFDLGGVLVRTEDMSSRHRLAGRLNIGADELYRLVFESETSRQASLGALTADQHWDAVRLALGVPPEEIRSVRDEFFAGDRVDYDLVNLLRLLRPRYKTGLLSNAWDDLRNMIVNSWRFQDAFDEMVISAEVGLVKPDRRIYELVTDRLKVAPAEAVLVDDFERNTLAAAQAGLAVVHFRNPQQARSELEQLLDGRI